MAWTILKDPGDFHDFLGRVFRPVSGLASVSESAIYGNWN
jgi:hypothetical protein